MTMIKTVKVALIFYTLVSLSACVTQQYTDEHENPVVQNDATNNEIAMTRISLGIGYLNIGNTKQAKLNLEKAKRFAPNLVQVHTAFAHYYDTVGEPEQAIAAYEKALSIKENDADTLNNYGVFLCRQGHLAKAEAQLLKAIAVPSYILVSESYENLALCHLKASNFLETEEYLNKSITHSPTRASSLLQMAKLQYAKNDYSQAQDFTHRYEKATRRFNPDALAFSFKLHEKRRDLKTAKNYANMLLKMFPHSYEAKQYLLNGLVEIEADKLALTYREKNSTKKKKRVVKLTPKNTKRKTQNNVAVIEEASNNRSIPAKTEASSNTEITNINKHNTAVNSDQNQTVNIVSAMPEKQVLKVAQFLAKSTANASQVIASKNSELNNKTKVSSNASSQKTINLPIHIVNKGDSLFSISKKYNIHMSAILKWNKLKKSKIIRIGDVIYLADPKKAGLNE